MPNRLGQMLLGRMGSQMGRLRQRPQGVQQQGLPPGIDPRAVAANPQGFARQQAMMQRAGGDPRRAAMMQMLQQRMGQRQQAASGQQQLLGRMLAARGAQGRQGQMRRLGSPLQALKRRRAGRMAGNRQLLQQKLAAR